MNKESAG